MEHEHLAVRLRPGADADGRDVNRARHPSRQDGRHPFQHEAESAGLLERLCVRQDPFGLSLCLALHLESAQLVHELRRQSKVPHHGDAHLGELLRDLDDAAAAFQLDRVHAAFLHETPRALDGLLDRQVIGHEWHVAHEQGLPRPACHRLGVVDHLVQRHRQCGRVAQHHHAQAVAN